MGHMHRYQQGPRSTKKLSIKKLMNEEYEEDITLPRKSINQHHYVRIQIAKFEVMETIATVQSERFPLTLHRGNVYIMCLYN